MVLPVFTCHTSHVTHHTSHITHHTSHITRYTSHITHHTSHITHHTSHITHHTSHFTHHTSHITCHTSNHLTAFMQGKGAPQLWLVGSGGQIVCIHSPMLSAIVMRCQSDGQKPDVTSFFDGFISLLPVPGAPLLPGASSSDGKLMHGGIRKDHDSTLHEQKNALTGVSNYVSAPTTSSRHQTMPDTDIRRLKQVLDTINTTKTIAKITLTQQVRRAAFPSATRSISSRRVFRSGSGARHSSSSTKTRRDVLRRACCL